MINYFQSESFKNFIKDDDSTTSESGEESDEFDAMLKVIYYNYINFFIRTELNANFTVKLIIYISFFFIMV